MAGMNHLAFRLSSPEEVDRAAEFLRGKEIEILKGPLTHKEDRDRYLYFKDPDGNVIELVSSTIEGWPRVFQQNGDLQEGDPSVDFDLKAKELGLELTFTPAPAGSYVACVQSGAHLFISGQIPRAEGGIRYAGKVGEDLSLEDGAKAARLCAQNALAVAKGYLGSLNRIRRVVRVLGFVRSAAGFHQQPKVLDGASDLMVSLFGERGKHARAAVGVNELPGGSAVEVEVILELG
jgi:enamine deaminase RidA (YjgF/YER057c/UK114 family)